MRCNSFFYSIFTLLLLNSCNQSKKPITIAEVTSIYFPHSYKVSSQNSEWGIGEAIQEYELIISANEYLKTKESIEAKSYFKILDSRKVSHEKAFDYISDLKKDTEVAYKYLAEERYFYQIFKPGKGIVVSIVLREDSIMYLKYQEL